MNSKKYAKLKEIVHVARIVAIRYYLGELYFIHT